MAASITSTGSATCGDALDEVVSFVNPHAAEARSRRRVKLVASRARMAALAAAGACNAGGTGGGGGSGGLSEKEVRKQQRMLRNRESAALSRKRKSDRIGELEMQVEALQEENRRLRQRIHRQDGDVNANGGAPMGSSGCRVRPPPTAAWAPSNVAATAALSATSAIVPSGSSTTVVPTTPPVDILPDPASNLFHTDTGCSAAASSPATACFNISRPAVFA